MAGAIVGLVAGLLLAPDKGENTRENLANTADKLREQLNRLAGRSSAGVDQLRGYLSKEISGLSPDVRSRILTILDEAEEMAYRPATATGTSIGNGVV
jgi:gas vesicle protein